MKSRARPDSPAPSRPTPVIGIALGSGSARGWSHIGVLQALAESGIEPQIVCGASMGALVGASYVGERLDELAAWAGALRRHRFLRMIDLRMPASGLVQGGRLMEALSEFIPDVEIGALSKPFGAVATDLATGREVWLRDGRLMDAVRASIAVPGLLAPVRQGERWLLDGGLTNPVPVSLCRALGANVVIGVNPFGDRMARFNSFGSGEAARPAAPHADSAPERGAPESEASAAPPAREPGWLRRRVQPRAGSDDESDSAEGHGGKSPGMLDVLVGALNIMQDRITRSRMAGDPPDVLLAPRISHISLLEFDRATEAIAEGRACVERMLPALQDVMGH